MYFYAQLNENKICTGISQLSGQVSSDNLVEIPELSDDYLWRKYENGEWSEEKYFPSEPALHTTIEEQIYAENLYQTALLEIQSLGGV